MDLHLFVIYYGVSVILLLAVGVFLWWQTYLDRKLLAAKIHYRKAITNAVHPVSKDHLRFAVKLECLEKQISTASSIAEINDVIREFHSTILTPSAEHTDARGLFNEIMTWYQVKKAGGN